MLLSAVATGFALGFALIFSLGPQNLMLIRAGVERSHPFAVASTGYISEIILIALGIGGVGTLISYYPQIAEIMQIACAGFLAWWGCRILGRLSRASEVRTARRGSGSFYQAIGSMLVVSWVNPLAWIEGMLFVGAMSSSPDVAGFATGFLAASAIKFYGWSFAGMSLSRYFDDAVARKRLDTIMGLVLLATAALIASSLFGLHLGS